MPAIDATAVVLLGRGMIDALDLSPEQVPMEDNEIAASFDVRLDGGVIPGSLPQEADVEEITRQLANLVLGPADTMLGTDGLSAFSALLELSDGLSLGPVGPIAGTTHTYFGSEPELECFHEVLHDPLEPQLEVSLPPSLPAMDCSFGNSSSARQPSAPPSPSPIFHVYSRRRTRRRAVAED